MIKAARDDCVRWTRTSRFAVAAQSIILMCNSFKQTPSSNTKNLAELKQLLDTVGEIFFFNAHTHTGLLQLGRVVLTIANPHRNTAAMVQPEHAHHLGLRD